jgi:hypothetical protein
MSLEINQYSKELSDKEIEEGGHKVFVGGMWDEIGQLQFDCLVREGLKPDMKFADIGCGCLRGGGHFVRFLDPGNYRGLDVNESLLKAGWEKELAEAELKDRLPRENLLKDDHFQLSRFNVEFDFALAMSVFTHLPLNHIRVCLIELSKCMKVGGKFFTTIFECPEDQPWVNELVHEPGGVTTFAKKDPYHYRVKGLNWCLEGLSWEMRYAGDWGHPRGQKMLCFEKCEG